MRDDVMKVKGNLVAAVALGAAMACGASLAGITPARAAAPAHTVSREVGKPLKAAQEDLQKADYSGALSKLNEADAMPKKTPYEQHLIHEMEGYAYVRSHQYVQAAKALEPGLTDGFLDAAQIPQRTVALAQLNYQIKNYDKAIEYGTQAIDKGYADAQMPTLVGQAYYLKNDWRGVQHFERQQVANDEKKGQTPTNEALQLLLSSCLKLSDENCTDNALQELVVYHPKPEYWQQLLYSMFKTVKSDRNLLQTYRLAEEVNVLKRPEDFTDFAQLAIEAGSPGEAQHLLADAQRASKRDQQTLDKNAREAAAASNGQQDVGLGLAYIGYQQYDKAIQALTQGISKGGLKSAGEAHLLLGIAQFKAGNKDAALKSFKSVKGDPTLERIATLWSLRARQGVA